MRQAECDAPHCAGSGLGTVTARKAMRDSWHLYEAIIGNARVWLKLQASCPSSDPAASFEYRFTGADYTPADGQRPVTQFRLSERSRYIANWSSIVESLPSGWDDEEYRIVETAYPWCGTLADDCDCHGTKGRLDIVHCSDFGVVDQKEKRSGKTRNVRYEHYIQVMEERIADRDEELREERRRRGSAPANPGSDSGKAHCTKRYAAGFEPRVGSCARTNQWAVRRGLLLLDPRVVTTPTASSQCARPWRTFTQAWRRFRLGPLLRIARWRCRIWTTWPLTVFA